MLVFETSSNSLRKDLHRVGFECVSRVAQVVSVPLPLRNSTRRELSHEMQTFLNELRKPQKPPYRISPANYFTCKNIVKIVQY